MRAASTAILPSLRSDLRACEQCFSLQQALALAPSAVLLGFAHMANAMCSLDHRHSGQLTWLFAGYIGEFEFVDDHRGGKLVVELNGRWAAFATLCRSPF